MNVTRTNMPGFSAERSLYKTKLGYCTIDPGFYENTAISLAAKLFPQDCANCKPSKTLPTCCGDCECCNCCGPGGYCTVDANGCFAGCCFGTPCVDSNGNPYCANEHSVCCGDGPCDTREYTCCGGDACVPKTVANCPPWAECLSPGICVLRTPGGGILYLPRYMPWWPWRWALQ